MEKLERKDKDMILKEVRGKCYALKSREVRKNRKGTNTPIKPKIQLFGK